MKKSKVKLLIEKLGWQDMPKDVALDAVQKIVNNYISCLSDCCGVQPLNSNVVLDILLSNDFDSDKVYQQLFIHDYYSLNDAENLRLAVSLRWEIEDLMRCGNTFEQARQEYDI